jgi:hypothetical protein
MKARVSFTLRGDFVEVSDKIILNLKDAGCPEDVVNAFIQESTTERRLRILARYRGSLLDKIHTEQKKLDCLDYLIFNIKKERKK